MRLKILIAAYACSPYRGSEPGVGWGFVAELAKHHDLWVVVEKEEFEADINRYLNENPDFPASVHFYFIRNKNNRLLPRIWPPSYYWYYRRWHLKAFKLAQQLHAHINFDLTHQLNMTGFREPGYLWQLDVPFVWGPIGGFGTLPWRFLPSLGMYGSMYYIGYNLLNSLHMRYLSRPKMAAKIAQKGLIAMNGEAQRGLKKHYSLPSSICIPVGPPGVVSKAARPRIGVEPLRIVWVGLHIPRKALNLALHALSLLPKDLDWNISILGSGELQKSWEKLALRLGLESRCRFIGHVTREEVIRTMSQSHVHLFSSLREGTPSVIAEAAALGVPTICIDLAGMSDMIVHGHNGIKIHPRNPGYVIKEMAKSIEMLAGDESLRLRLATNALSGINDLQWDKKIEFLNEIYRSKIHSQTTLS